jgi:hypothetical protein
MSHIEDEALLKSTEVVGFNALVSVVIERAIAYVQARLPRKKVRGQLYSATFSPLPLLHVFAGLRGAQDVSTEVSLKNVFDLGCKAVGREIEIKENYKQGAWMFGNLCAGNILYQTVEYGEACPAAISFIVADSKESAHSFLGEYRDIEWKTSRSEYVLDYEGNKLTGFRPMEWNNIFLGNGTRDAIRKEVKTFFASEKLYKEYGLDWRRGLMLAGKPGNGKTAVCRAITTEASRSSIPVIFCALDKDDICSIIATVSETIGANAPCVVIFEDADTIGASQNARAAFLNMIDGLFSLPGVLAVASTNSPEKLDSAFTSRPSRFDSFYVFGDPGIQESMAILLNKLGEAAKGIEKSEVKEAIGQMAGISASGVQEVAVCCLLERLRTGRKIDISAIKAGIKKVKDHFLAAEVGLDRLSKGAVGFDNKECCSNT